MDQEGVGFTFLPTHQDGTTISALAFDCRISGESRRPPHSWAGSPPAPGPAA